jgi:hypothetical protein
MAPCPSRALRRFRRYLPLREMKNAVLRTAQDRFLATAGAAGDFA